MTPAKKNCLYINALYWIVAAMIHPVVSLLPTTSGEMPKIYSLLIPLVFIGLAFGSTLLMLRAMGQQGQS